MDNKLIPSIIFVILGLIIIFFPLLGVLALNLIIAIPIILVGIVLVVMGFAGNRNLLRVIFGILVIIFGIIIIAFPNFFATIISLLVALFGVVIMAYAVISAISHSERLNIIIVAFIIGLIYFVIGYLIRSPEFLGVLIGIALLLIGGYGIIDQYKSKYY